jgi:tripartite-type tricarboxylate transporter receptor subunit TctC
LVMRAKPDGYTLLFTASHHILYPLLYKADYDALKSFIPIAKMGTETMCLVVHPSLPVHSVQELIALAKKQPGQLLMSVAGVGSFGHFETADFMSMAGIDMKQVMFKGAGAMLLDTLGGHSQVSITGPTIALGHIQDGKLRALATTGSKRNKVLPHVPTISEAGVPGFEAALWWAIFAPLGTPQAIVDRLSKEITAIMNSEETKNAFEKVGADPDLMGPAEMVKLFEKETAKYAKLVKEGKIKAE